MNKAIEEEKRVVFTFDARSLESLEALKQKKGFRTLAETVRDSIRIRGAIQKQSDSGYTEIIVRNPTTGQEKVMVLP